jgi:predicted Fe-Mo cluster-binding NifX family protein
MKVGIPERQGRVSPVFDSARHLWIFRIENGRPAEQMTTLLHSRDPVEKARQVARFGVNLLICGALSWPLFIALSSEGVEVRPFLCGSIEEIIAAYCDDRLGNECFQMPGTRQREQNGAGAGKKRKKTSGQTGRNRAASGDRSL